MVEYRIYDIGDDGHIVGSTPLICKDDNEAIEKARQVGKEKIIEIWSGERFVTRLRRADND